MGNSLKPNRNGGIMPFDVRGHYSTATQIRNESLCGTDTTKPKEVQMAVKEIILQATRYEREPGELRFSASMFSSTDLQNYLTILHGAQDSLEIDQSVIGSVFHLGMETLMKERYPKSDGIEQQISYDRPDGWSVTARMDWFDTSTNVFSIHDWKLTKKYAGTMLKKDMNHPYRRQVNVARHIMVKNGSQHPMAMFIHMFYKDQDQLKGDLGYEAVNVGEIRDIEQQIDAKIKSLNGFIESGTEPPECTNEEKWFRKTKAGITIPSRCNLYCGAKDFCPYYKKPSLSTAAATW